MKKLISSCLLLICSLPSFSQAIYSLDSCRTMALKNNKEILMADEKIKAAGYEVKSSRAHYLPGIDASAAYLHNTKDISLISDEQINKIAGALDKVSGSLGGILDKVSPGLSSALQGMDQIPDRLKDALTFDVKDMFVGTVSITQPLYMGGKIRAYHAITEFSEDLARSMRNTAVKDLIVEIDQTYWQVVSLVYKKQMAESYVGLLESLTSDVNNMYEYGFATKSDQLSVAVKLNEAQVALTKVNDGLVLSKMLLAQLCGLPITADYNLVDENTPLTVAPLPENIDMSDVFKRRSELRSLELVTDIYKKKEIITRSDMLPQVALMGNYAVTNPHVFDGFQKKFSGMFTVGVGVKIPIWHWGQNYYKLKVSQAETRTSVLKLEDAREKIELQVNQAVFRTREANKTLLMSITNMNKADENLQNAQVGYQEGMLTTQNVLEAQTAWLKAQSEKIDAEIGVRLSDIYLSKAIGKNF